MAQFAVHLEHRKVTPGVTGLHGTYVATENSGWVTLEMEGDCVTLHARDPLTLCCQLEEAAKVMRAQLCEEIRQRDEQSKSS